MQSSSPNPIMEEWPTIRELRDQPYRSQGEHADGASKISPSAVNPSEPSAFARDLLVFAIL
jgi:hypothetical protein